jgi:hypothetical protein
LLGKRTIPSQIVRNVTNLHIVPHVPVVPKMPDSDVPVEHKVPEFDVPNVPVVPFVAFVPDEQNMSSS